MFLIPMHAYKTISQNTLLIATQFYIIKLNHCQFSTIAIDLINPLRPKLILAYQNAK